jgi:hypothetical protein
MDATMKKLQIPGKESASIAYHLFPSTAPTTRGRMVVFLNGMMGPQMTWHPVIKECLSWLEVRKLSPIEKSTVIRADVRMLALSDSSHTTDLPNSMASLKIPIPQTSDHSATTLFKSLKTSTLSSSSWHPTPNSYSLATRSEDLSLDSMLPITLAESPD